MTIKGRGSWVFGCLVWVWSQSWSMVAADQIVYLERPSGGSTWEPLFNPKTINAVIGENITFIARFNPIIHDSTSEVFSSPLAHLASIYKFGDLLTIVIRSTELGICRIQFHSAMRLQRRYFPPIY